MIQHSIKNTLFITSYLPGSSVWVPSVLTAWDWAWSLLQFASCSDTVDVQLQRALITPCVGQIRSRTRGELWESPGAARKAKFYKARCHRRKSWGCEAAFGEGDKSEPRHNWTCLHVRPSELFTVCVQTSFILIVSCWRIKSKFQWNCRNL